MTSIFLSQPVKSLFRLQESQAKALATLRIKTVRDLLYYFPKRYDSITSSKLIVDLVAGDQVTVYGRIKNLKTGKSFRGKMPKAEGTVFDETSSVKVIWFHQPYIAKLIQNDSLVKLHGKVSERNGVISMLNPEIEPVSSVPGTIGNSLFAEQGEDGASVGAMIPVYGESKGITSRWLYHALQKLFSSEDFSGIVDPIPEEIRERYSLPSLTTSLIWIHSPKKEADSVVARKRFAFEEIFFIQLKNEQQRAIHSREKAFIIETKSVDENGKVTGSKKTVEEFTSRFPFPLTESQHKSIEDVLADFAKGYPMSRLLEGDVGSGKTAVAASTAYAAVTSRPKGQNFGTLQVGYMAPTEILAKQHFESFIQYFRHMPISIGLITGNGCRKFPSKLNPGGWTDISRSQFQKWVANGEIAIVIGTHALIQKSVAFKHLAYVIIDEQHRFGTAQRQRLTKKQAQMPHLLSMTATPIPRTLALTLYGDLDLSLLDQMPSGRKKVITEIVVPAHRDNVYEKIRTELQAGRQAYVICPRIAEPDPDKEQTLAAKSVKAEAKRLQSDVFPEYRIDIMHSKMKPAEKDKVMDRFSRHEIDILVSTSVVEVGVNVPNASIIVIEGGERFGLSQLHQLRGRVIRGNHQPYCYVFTSESAQAKSGKVGQGARAAAPKQSDKTADRLKALVTAKNGFELSELDMAQRGVGELYGSKQWGISDLAMEAIKNIKMVEAARKEAKAIIEEHPTVEKLAAGFPLLSQALEAKKDIHFE
ncbi:MAG TPA: ATP-dependent DNA helicase RecG [Candidatus Paceibacterota bacterium]